MGIRFGLLSIFSEIPGLKLKEVPKCGVVAFVVAARVMREEGITVDKMMDLVMVIEKEFCKGRRH